MADQHAALSHLANALDQAEERLRVLDLRLGAPVARTAQVVLRPGALEELGQVDRKLGGVMEELEAVRAGLEAARAVGA
ncbi:MAG: hypothetical protein M3203_05275 [Actinomycetota bacterium]|nr:hypothetical protein [Actinomycetota bacterium]